MSKGLGASKLDYVYDNQPDNAIEDRSRRHTGSTALAVVGSPVTKLKGHYWTDRDSSGGLEFTGRRSSKFAEDFESAEALFK